MKLSPAWLREFVDASVDDRRLAQDLTAVGIAVESISGEGKNTVFEMEIGTNRPDAMNHYGVAREASVIYNLPLLALDSKLPAAPGNSDFAIEIADRTGCARYTARVVRDVKIKPSPDAMAKRLLLVDQRPINNAADATNYTLWEMGHPTHVFDLDLLEGGQILVRRAFSGETLKTLDGVERKLTPEDLVIADAVKPVALAGVMGGFDTMITAKTKNILIESAWFDPATVRKTARLHGLHTDASHRFERGADFEATTKACDRVAVRLLESAGGELDGGAIDVVARQVDLAPVALHLSEVHRILGEKLETNEIFRILQQLGFELMPERGGDPDFTVHIPSWRLDVEREIDLVEEIARLHGYDKFANTLPAYAGAVVEVPDAEKDLKLRSSLLALGYDEAVSLTFISHEDAETFSSAPVVELANPQSEEASVMRSSLVPGMLNMLAYNLNRGADRVRLFEAGSIFEATDSGTAEPKRICMGATSPPSAKNAEGWGTQDGGFFDLKGDVENLLQAFQHQTLTYDAQTSDYYHSGRSARALMDGALVAQFGQLHPDVAARRKLRQSVFVAELYVDRLYQQGLRVVRYQPLPRYPAVERDFSFVFDDAATFEQIQRAVIALGVAELRSFVPVEIFRGGNVPAGRYSLLLRARFQSAERTLREEEVAQWSAQIIKALESLGGKLRV
ncbi:MAG TPA: phenylalanine--tRNA ligase subunit beta [Terriglobales bacterium]|nr:phenylalanine--tRNA ligase subunit beta [Terriglobales bacterium]